MLDRAERRLTTALAGLGGGDVEGACVAAYDADRMTAESLLMRQCLRSTGAAGSHVTVEDAVSAQFASAVTTLAEPTFERFRRMHHKVLGGATFGHVRPLRLGVLLKLLGEEVDPSPRIRGTLAADSRSAGRCRTSRRAARRRYGGRVGGGLVEKGGRR